MIPTESIQSPPAGSPLGGQPSSAEGSASARPTVKSSSSQTKSWTFLTNHTHVLVLLHNEPNLVLREVAKRVGITERAVQRIIADLERGKFVRREKVGRRNRYEVIVDKPLRHPIESHRNIGDLLTLVNSSG